MAEEYRRAESVHNIVLEGREKLSVSGVVEVVSFDENELVIETSRGQLTVEGDGLHVEKLSLEVGELCVMGNIESMIYTETPKSRGFWSRIF